MRRVALLLACLAVSGVVGGCELLVGIKDKTTGDGGGAGDAGAGGEAGQDPSAACSQQPPGFFFCDDFDSEQEAGDTWLWDTPMDGGSVEMYGGQAKTPPHSVQVTVPSAPADGQLGKQIGSPMNGYRLAFDMFIETPDLSSIPQVGVAQGVRYTPGGGPPLEVDYVVGPGSVCELRITDGATNPVVTLQVPPTRRWTRIVIAYDAVQGASVLEDGMPIGTSTAAAHGPPGDTEIIVGAVYSNVFGGGPTTPFVVDIDDVVVRVN